MGLLLALSALNMPDATAATSPIAHPTIEARLTRLSTAIQERASQLPDSERTAVQRVAIGWGDGSGRDWANGRGRGWADGYGDRGWGNTRGGGWADGNGGGWANANPWRNGWADGGGFYNYRY